MPLSSVDHHLHRRLDVDASIFSPSSLNSKPTPVWWLGWKFVFPGRSKLACHARLVFDLAYSTIPPTLSSPDYPVPMATTTLYPPPVRHGPSNTAQASNLDDLFVPAQQDAHGRASRLIRCVWSPSGLAEPCLLWSDACRRSWGASAPVQ